MMRKLIPSLNGSLSALIYFLNTLFWVPLVLILALLKLLPFATTRRWLTYGLDTFATSWISVNNLNQKLFSRTKIDVHGLHNLSKKDWYLVIANHQSWVDILILQNIFNRKIPFLKFFLKQELIWVPLLGLAWWALDFPFMRRYKKSYLAKNPHLKGKDMEATQKACEKFKTKPVSIMNFVEGTRFTPSKHARQNAVFTHLLKPKAGGIAYVLNAMGGQMHKLINVTIWYPEGIPTFWDFISGRVPTVKVSVETHTLDGLFPSDVEINKYFESPEQRARFQQWLNQQWQQKDDCLSQWQDS